MLLALGGSPQHERAFDHGGRGEESVARSLERRVAGGPAVLLHDRRMPNGHGNIDHLAIVPRGVYVIDAKAIKGKVRVRSAAHGRQRLQVEGHTHNKLIAGLARQVAVVREEIEATGTRDVATTGVLCFTKADIPLLGRKQIDGYLLRYRRALGKELAAPGALTADRINSLALLLGERFPPA